MSNIAGASSAAPTGFSGVAFFGEVPDGPCGYCSGCTGGPHGSTLRHQHRRARVQSALLLVTAAATAVTTDANITAGTATAATAIAAAATAANTTAVAATAAATIVIGTATAAANSISSASATNVDTTMTGASRSCVPRPPAPQNLSPNTYTHARTPKAQGSPLISCSCCGNGK